MNKQKPESEPATTAAEPTQPAEVEFELSLEDTQSQHKRVLTTKGTPPVGGYNPYDAPVSGADDRARNADEPKRKPTDLRKLSEWIRLQRQVKALKKDPPDSE